MRLVKEVKGGLSFTLIVILMTLLGFVFVGIATGGALLDVNVLIATGFISFVFYIFMRPALTKRRR